MKKPPEIFLDFSWNYEAQKDFFMDFSWSDKAQIQF